MDLSKLNATVSGVLQDIKENGDEAIKKYEEKFDHVKLSSLEVSEEEINEAFDSISSDLKASLEQAHHNIAVFHEAQKFGEGQHIETCKGVTCWQKSIAIEKVVLYIPGVMAAKQQVSIHDVAIDMPAGPSEVCVYADETSNPVYVAADLLSQAEHGIDSQVIMITTSKQLLDDVRREIDKQLQPLPRRELAAKTLENSKLVLVKDSDEAMALCNLYAPEHLIIATADYERLADKVVNAGSVFLGQWACESAGDYASGTNHTLPTHQYALAYNGVNLDSYNRKVTFQHLNEDGIRSIGKTVVCMAENEQLEAHANAMRLRMDSLGMKNK